VKKKEEEALIHALQRAVLFPELGKPTFDACRHFREVQAIRYSPLPQKWLDSAGHSR